MGTDSGGSAATETLYCATWMHNGMLENMAGCLSAMIIKGSGGGGKDDWGAADNDADVFDVVGGKEEEEQARLLLRSGCSLCPPLGRRGSRRQYDQSLLMRIFTRKRTLGWQCMARGGMVMI